MVPELLDLAAAVPPGADGVIALPYLEGERAPRWNRDLRGELFGLSVASGPGVVARALIESTAYGLAHIANGLAGNGIVLKELVCGGGPSRSPLWTKIKASVLEVPVKVPEHPELAAYGAALGWWPAPRSGRPGDWPTPQMTTIQPEPREEYRTGYRRFVELGDAAAARLAREDW
jgi:xylulokinase